MNESMLSDASHSKKKDYLNPNIRSYEESLSYTKKLIVVAISNIVYLRSVFPEEVFATKDFENLKIKIIKSKDKDSQTLVDWLKGSFDALEKKYLKTLSLAIYTDQKDPENVLETYDFHLSYGKNVNLEFSSSKNFSDKVKLNSIRVLRSIMYSAQSLEDLPDKLFICMRLFYHDDVTPLEYEPPGFKPCDFESYKYNNGKFKISLGSVHCLWHQVKFEINCSNSMIKHKEDFAENLDTSINLKKTLNETVELAPLNVSVMTDDIKKEKNSQTVQETVDDTISKINDLKVASPQDINYSPIQSLKKISCICETSLENGMRLLKCNGCNCYQHSVCYNILISDEKFASEWEKDFGHFCLNCFKQLDDKTKQPTDLSIINLDKKKLVTMSVWRRLLFVLSVNKTDIFVLKEMSQTLNVKQNLGVFVQKLEKDSIIECISKKDGLYKINKSSLINFIQSTFMDPTRSLKENAEIKNKKLERRSSLDVDEESDDMNDSKVNEPVQKRQDQLVDVNKESAKRMKTSVSNSKISQF